MRKLNSAICWWWYICNLKNSSRNWTWFSSWRKFWRLKVFFAAAAPVVISDLQGPAIDLNSSKKTLIYNQITFLLPLFVSSFRFRKPWVSGKLVGMFLYSSAPNFSTILTRNVRPAPALLIKHIHLVALKFSFLSSLPRLELELLCWYELLGIQTGSAFLASKAPDLTTKCELWTVPVQCPVTLRNPNSDSAVKEMRKNVV